VRQQPCAADIGDETDACFRHGEPGTLRDNPVASMTGEADAAAHDDAVLERDIGLRVAADQGVDLVFVAPERPGKAGPFRAAVIQ
jgi:hypothetical protein